MPNGTVNWDARIERLANAVLREVAPTLIIKYLEHTMNAKVHLIGADTPAYHCPGCPGCYQEEGTEDTVPCTGVEL